MLKVARMLKFLGYIFLPVFFAALSLWKVFENDIFWQIHAGEEILRGTGVQSVDTWSSTAYHTPWFNFQWISTVIFAVVANSGPTKYFYLPLLRSALIAVIFLQFEILILKFSRATKHKFLLQLFLLPIFYIVVSGRMQLRPEIFALIFFFVLTMLWQSKKTADQKIGWSFVTLVVWANFHGGTVPFGIALCCLHAVFETKDHGFSLRKQALAVFLFFGAWLLTPIGPHVIEVVLSLTKNYDWRVVGNPDQQPISLGLFFDIGGSTLILWSLVSVAASVYLGYRLVKEGVKREILMQLCGLIFFTFMTMKRIRARGYDFIFIAPLFIEPLILLLKLRATQFVMIAAALAIWLYALPGYLKGMPNTGFGIEQGMFPVGAVDFIKRERPAKNIYNYYDFGGYLIDQLPEYPVSLDSREILFMKFSEERRQSIPEERGFQKLLEKHNLNMVLAKNTSAAAQLTNILPKENWAKVFMDPVAIVYIKRMPENAKIISQFEQ